MTCKKCSTPLEPSQGPGQPRKFCSVECRRLAEFTIRRLNRRMDTLEDQLAMVNRGLRRGDDMFIYGLGRPKEALPLLEAEIQETEARLRLLL